MTLLVVEPVVAAIHFLSMFRFVRQVLQGEPELETNCPSQDGEILLGAQAGYAAIFPRITPFPRYSEFGFCSGQDCYGPFVGASC